MKLTLALGESILDRKKRRSIRRSERARERSLRPLETLEPSIDEIENAMRIRDKVKECRMRRKRRMITVRFISIFCPECGRRVTRDATERPR